MRYCAVLFAVLLLTLAALAAPQDAVVRMPSHGISGTVIRTEQGSSLILTCAHGFPGAAAQKPITLDAPWPQQPGQPQRVGLQLLKVNHQSDLALVKLNFGPVPYVCPVAPEGFKPGKCLSVGYDEMKQPPQCRPCDILGLNGGWWHTRQKPWHGRSGGALIDEATGQLVGVVSGYVGPQVRTEVMPGSYGVYASHRSILTFLQTGTFQAGPPRLREERSFGTPTQPPGGT